ncbi:MAG: ethylbenzene dehydrogenase-related protein [Desulfurococcales archaeon]|nr:ethylbenzene dehydrogenase-related protein [Desulfurococcales archaeon]
MNKGRLLALVLLASLAITAGSTMLDTPLVTAQTPELVARFVNGSLPLDPGAKLWADLDLVEVTLGSQSIVYPLTPTSVATLRIAAAYNLSHVAFYIEWDDPSMDVEVPGGLDVFADAVAMQFPVSDDSLPYICMGTVSDPVYIVYWKAPEMVEALVAGSGYGLSPEEREALGLSKTPKSPIEKLPESEQDWISSATYEDGKWRLVVVRASGSSHPLETEFRPGGELGIVLARWEGSEYERGGLKKISGWMSLKLEEPPVGFETVTETTTVEKTVTVVEELERVPYSVFVVAGLALIVAAATIYVMLRRRPSSG